MNDQTSPARGLSETHCHLNHEQFEADRDQALERARRAGIERLLVVGYDLASSRAAVSIARANDDCQAVIGIHPETAAEWDDATRGELLALCASDRHKIAAWGEIGLDYHWRTIPPEAQRQAFSDQIDLAVANGLPAVIHCRDAYDDVLDILAAKRFNRAVLHCFTGTSEQAARALAMGLYLGVGGIATFKKSSGLRDLYADPFTPLERLLLETDSPYLAPQPWRGKRDEPAYIVAVAELLAELKNCSLEEIAQQTSRNADVLFGRMRNENAVDR